VRYLWPWLGPPLTTMQYVVYFGFVDDVWFSHIRAYVVKMGFMVKGCQSVGGNARRAELQRSLSTSLSITFC